MCGHTYLQKMLSCNYFSVHFRSVLDHFSFPFARFSFVFRSSLVRHSFADKKPIEKRTRKQRKNSEMTTRTRRRWIEMATNSQLSNRRHHLVIPIPVLRHLQGVCGESTRRVVHWQVGVAEMATRGVSDICKPQDSSRANLLIYIKHITIPISLHQV